MPVTWDIVITVTDLAEESVRATATRTDTDKDPVEVRTYWAEGKYDTVNKPLTRAKYADNFWEQYQVGAEKDSQIAALVGAEEAAIASILDAKEAE